MAGSRTGTASIVALTRKICKLIGTYGAGDLAARTTTEFAAAVFALQAACAAFEALDNFPMQVDTSAPFGPEDEEGA